MYSATTVADRLPSTTTHPCRRFSLVEIQSSTKDFAEELVIGQGGFGKVYKGQISIEETDVLVAIKRSSSTSDQGAPEFRAEIEMLSVLRHCHLVSLVGYCDDHKEMILVYDYMPNGTLYDHLHKVHTPLSWVQRLKIAIGAGRGLDYLHTGVGTQHGVIHRDVKTSNILLDENWAAMISDFGLSKIGPTNQSFSYVETVVKGTFGYLDPEYYYTSKLTRKSDVYAFGVVLFELLSGRLAVDRDRDDAECSLVRWVQKCIKERKLDQMVDPNIKGTLSPRCLKQFAHVADRCLRSVPKERPTMTEVVASIQSLLDLQEKFENSATSSTGFSRKIQKYLVRATKDNPEVLVQSSVTTDQMAKLLSFLIKEKIGTVYKAQLADGQVVAIKQAKKEHFDALQGEFGSEVELLAKIDHLNLVKLLGYFDKGNERLIITEYFPNGTLREHLDGVHGSFLDFSQRLGICLDVAHGLTYLHLYAEKQIIHRDVKSSNILLTEKMRAKVADFGFARLGDAETDKTHVVTKVRGTVGYLDPEYMRTYQLTPKSDVYSFGVLLIEILTGRRPIESRRSPEEKVTVRWAFGKYKEGDIMDLVDPNMKEAIDVEIFTKMLALAFQCAAPTRADRPEMKVVGEQLWVIRMDYLRNGRRG